MKKILNFDKNANLCHYSSVSHGPRLRSTEAFKSASFISWFSRQLCSPTSQEGPWVCGAILGDYEEGRARSKL